MSIVVLPVVLATALAAGLLGVSLAADGWSPQDVLLCGTFTVLFVWIAFWLWVALIGAFRLAVTRKTRRAVQEVASSRPPLDVLKTAIVVPIHNENPDAVFARVRSMLESIAAAGASAA